MTTAEIWRAGPRNGSAPKRDARVVGAESGPAAGHREHAGQGDDGEADQGQDQPADRLRAQHGGDQEQEGKGQATEPVSRQRSS